MTKYISLVVIDAIGMHVHDKLSRREAVDILSLDFGNAQLSAMSAFRAKNGKLVVEGYCEHAKDLFHLKLADGTAMDCSQFANIEEFRRTVTDSDANLKISRLPYYLVCSLDDDCNHEFSVALHGGLVYTYTRELTLASCGVVFRVRHARCGHDVQLYDIPANGLDVDDATVGDDRIVEIVANAILLDFGTISCADNTICSVFARRVIDGIKFFYKFEDALRQTIMHLLPATEPLTISDLYHLTCIVDSTQPHIGLRASLRHTIENRARAPERAVTIRALETTRRAARRAGIPCCYLDPRIRERLTEVSGLAQLLELSATLAQSVVYLRPVPHAAPRGKIVLRKI